MCRSGKNYDYMQRADIERRRWGKKDILRLTGYRLGFLILLRFFGLFTFLLKHFHLLSLSIRYALDRQTDLRVHRLLHSASWPARALEARVMRRADKQVGWGPDGWKAAALAAFIVPGASAAWSWAAPIGLELPRRSAFQGRSEH